jgi:hypothetical protein
VWPSSQQSLCESNLFKKELSYCPFKIFISLKG